MEATFWCILPKLEFKYIQLVSTLESADIGSGQWKPLFGVTYLATKELVTAICY